MSATTTRWLCLERDPNSSARQLSVKGRRIKARTLFGLYASREEPMSVEAIAEAYELPVQVVREAIEYCQSNPPEIREDLRVEESLAQAAGMNRPGYRMQGKPATISPQEYERIRRGDTDETVP